MKDILTKNFLTVVLSTVFLFLFAVTATVSVLGVMDEGSIDWLRGTCSGVLGAMLLEMRNGTSKAE